MQENLVYDYARFSRTLRLVWDWRLIQDLLFFCFQRTLYTSYYIFENLSTQQLIQEIEITKTATIAIIATHAIIEQLIHN